jgi:hypothetical protein
MDWGLVGLTSRVWPIGVARRYIISLRVGGQTTGLQSSIESLRTPADSGSEKIHLQPLTYDYWPETNLFLWTDLPTKGRNGGEVSLIEQKLLYLDGIRIQRNRLTRKAGAREWVAINWKEGYISGGKSLLLQIKLYTRVSGAIPVFVPRCYIAII